MNLEKYIGKEVTIIKDNFYSYDQPGLNKKGIVVGFVDNKLAIRFYDKSLFSGSYLHSCNNAKGKMLCPNGDGRFFSLESLYFNDNQILELW